MSRLRKAPRRRDAVVSQSNGRLPTGPTAVVAILLFGVGFLFWQLALSPGNATKDKNLKPKSAMDGQASSKTSSTANANKVTSNFSSLVGRWVRTDGGYVIEINGVEDTGKVNAVYLNPKLINVEKAEATISENFIKLAIVLRDKNYPGSTYELTLSSDSQTLKGFYFQAMQQELFQVEFQREQPK